MRGYKWKYESATVKEFASIKNSRRKTDMVPVLEIIRVEENFEYGTFGILRINKEVFCVTLEPSDEENASNISSIPAQQYICRRVNSPKYGDVFEVTNVPGRTHVLIHAGNVDEHTTGCILLGQYFGKLRGDRAVLNSGKTLTEFMRRMTMYNSLHLTIKEEF